MSRTSGLAGKIGLLFPIVFGGNKAVTFTVLGRVHAVEYSKLSTKSLGQFIYFKTIFFEDIDEVTSQARIHGNESATN